MDIQPAVDADRQVIWAMLEPVFRQGDTYAIDPAISEDDALSYWYAEHVFLARDAEEPVGTFYIQRNRPGGGAHYCNCGFVTNASAQGRGVAQAMLDEAMSRAKALGFQGMVFNFVVASNVRAVALWRRNGFEVVGRVPGAFRSKSGRSDALLMFQEL